MKNHLNLLEHTLGFLRAKGKNNYGGRDVSVAKSKHCLQIMQRNQVWFPDPHRASSKKLLGVVLHARVTALPEAKPEGLLQVWG